MKSTIQFDISKDKEGYTASGVGLSVVTQANSLDELMSNIHEAVSVYFSDEDINALGFQREPSILVNYELTEEMYA